MQKTIEKTKKIFNDKGEITFGGWSRFPLFEYNKNDYPQKIKLTEKDCYYITDGKIGFYLAVETAGLELTVRLMLCDYARGEIYSDSVNRKFLLDMPVLPESGTLGEFSYKDKRIALTLTNTFEGRYIKCDFIDFNNYKNLFVKVLVKKTSGESMNTIAPFDASPKSFYLKRFAPKFSASGVIRLGGTDYNLSDLCCPVYLDWSRYSFPRRQKAQFLSGLAYTGGRKIAVNLASRLGNNAKGSENCYFIGDKLYKFGRLAVSGDEKNPESEWSFTSPDGTDSIVFTPKKTDAGVLACKCERMNAVFGTISGTLVNEDEKLELKDLPSHLLFAQL